MEKTFFFYDLETSGRFPGKDRIMQFAGQRADMNLDLVGDPVNILVKLPNDTILVYIVKKGCIGCSDIPKAPSICK